MEVVGVIGDRRRIIAGDGSKRAFVGVIGDRRRCIAGGDNSKRATTKKSYSVLGMPFHLDEKYYPLRVLGKGAFGLVCACFNTVTGEHVAVKQIGNALNGRHNAVMALREMQILRQLRHGNVIRLKDVMLSSAYKEDFQQVYLVQELMDFDLGHVIDTVKLSAVHCRHLLFQIISGVGCLHSAHVIHRDLKPSNLLVNKDWQLKIADFGLARTKYEDSGPMELGVGTVGYKAPELILGCRYYGGSVDMWAVGCIFAEMLLGKPIFGVEKGVPEMNNILKVLGRRGVDFTFVEDMYVRKYIEGYLRFRVFEQSEIGTVLHEEGVDVDPLAMDLLKKLLAFNPSKRITAEEALNHPYFSGLYGNSYSISSSLEVRLEMDDNPSRLDEKMLRDLIWKEMLIYHPTF